LITTSRRTDPVIDQKIKAKFARHPCCKLLVIANESNWEGVTYGMLACSETAIVTEDSVSMTSEALSAGKPVWVLRLGNGKLPAKHRRFHEALGRNALVRFVHAANFKSQFMDVGAQGQKNVQEAQSRLIQEALRKLL